MNSELTPRQRVRLAFAHRETGRPPFSLGFGVNEPAKQALMAYLGHQNLAETDAYLDSFCDIRSIQVPYIGPADRCRTLPNGHTVDIWQVECKPVPYAAGGVYDEICHYPLAGVETIADLDAFPWPDPDWYDYDAIPALLNRVNPQGRYAIRLGNGNIFETGWYMRGFEQMFIDLLTQPS